MQTPTQTLTARPQRITYEIERARDGSYSITFFSPDENKWLAVRLTSTEQTFFHVLIAKINERLLQARIDSQAENHELDDGSKRPRFLN